MILLNKLKPFENTPEFSSYLIKVEKKFDEIIERVLPQFKARLTIQSSKISSINVYFLFLNFNFFILAVR